eukprot:gene345-978_t
MGFVEKLKKSPLIHLWMIVIFIVSELSFIGEWWANIDIKYYGDAEVFKEIGKESVLTIPNHRGDLDWLIGYILCERAGYLGASKTYMKSYIKFVPIIGWIWWHSDFFFLKRNWQSDQEYMNKKLQSLREFPTPFMLGLFVEGTRLTPEKLKASQEYAISKGIKPLKHHLLPRTKGFVTTINNLKDTIPVVYDVQTVCSNQEDANISSVLQGKTIDTHFYVRRLEMKDIPTDSEEATIEWLKELFIEKDKVMDYFFKHGRFEAPIVDYPRKKWNLYVTIMWNIVIAVPFLNLLICAFTSGSYLFLGGLLIFLIIGFVLLKFLIKLTDSKKGSSFGLSKKQQ